MLEILLFIIAVALIGFFPTLGWILGIIVFLIACSVLFSLLD